MISGCKNCNLCRFIIKISTAHLRTLRGLEVHCKNFWEDILELTFSLAGLYISSGEFPPSSPLAMKKWFESLAVQRWGRVFLGWGQKLNLDIDFELFWDVHICSPSYEVIGVGLHLGFLKRVFDGWLKAQDSELKSKAPKMRHEMNFHPFRLFRTDLSCWTSLEDEESNIEMDTRMLIYPLWRSWKHDWDLAIDGSDG